jgi:adenosylcobinamide-GDP ribazoletransferase
VYRFFAALGFLTAVPLPGGRRHSEEDMAGSVPFFPLVGLLIGVSGAALALCFEQIFEPLLLSVMLVLWLEGACRGLHLDGLGDTADGFLSHRSREQVLEIMRDSRIGAFGTMAVFGVLALKIAAFASLPGHRRWMAALLAPLAGRCSMVGMLGLMPCARPEGLGVLFCRHRPAWETLWAAAVLLAAAALTAGRAGTIAVVAAVAAVSAFAAWCRHKIGGITGDTTGASCEIAETVVLVVLSMRPLVGLWG